MTIPKLILILTSLLLVGAGVGCVTMSKFLTPASINTQAVEYAVGAGVADVGDYDGWPNLMKAEKLVLDVDTADVLIQERLQQALDRNDTRHNIVRGRAEANRQVAAQREEILFGETGLLSVGLSMVGAGGFAGLLGLMRKRPQDVTKTEMESVIAELNGKNVEDLDERDKQFVQLVKGVQEFMNTYENDKPEVVGELKASMDKHQDTGTKVAVATAKTKESV